MRLDRLECINPSPNTALFTLLTFSKECKGDGDTIVALDYTATAVYAVGEGFQSLS